MSIKSAFEFVTRTAATALLLVAGWLVYETNFVPTLEGIPVFGNEIQARCDHEFVRVRASAGTKDLAGRQVPILTTVAGGQRMALAGRSVRLSDQIGRWISVSVGGRSGWVRDDVVEPVRVCKRRLGNMRAAP